MVTKLLGVILIIFGECLARNITCQCFKWGHHEILLLPNLLLFNQNLQTYLIPLTEIFKQLANTFADISVTLFRLDLLCHQKVMEQRKAPLTHQIMQLLQPGPQHAFLLVVLIFAFIWFFHGFYGVFQLASFTDFLVYLSDQICCLQRRDCHRNVILLNGSLVVIHNEFKHF